MKRVLLVLICFFIVSSVFCIDTGVLSSSYSFYNTDVYFKKNYESVLNGFLGSSNPSAFFNDVKGEIGEALADSYFSSMQNGSWKRLNPRSGSQGLDHLYVRYDKRGNIRGLMVGESKYGSSKLGFTKDGEQFSHIWIINRLKKELERDKNLTDLEKKYIQGVIDGKITYRKSYVHTNYENGQFKTSIVDKTTGKELSSEVFSAKEGLLAGKGKIVNKLAKKLTVNEKELEKLINNSDESFSDDLMSFVDKGEINDSISKVASLKTDFKQLMKGSLKNAGIAAVVTFALDIGVQGLTDKSFQNIDWMHAGYWSGAAAISGGAAYIAKNVVTKQLTKKAAGQSVKTASKQFANKAAGQSAKTIAGQVGAIAGIGIGEAVMFGASALWDWGKVSRGEMSKELYKEKLKKNGIVSGASVGAGVLVAGAVTFFTGGAAAPLAAGIASGVSGLLTGLFCKELTETSPKVLWKKLENNKSVGNQWCTSFMQDKGLATNKAIKKF